MAAFKKNPIKQSFAWQIHPFSQVIEVTKKSVSADTLFWKKSVLTDYLANFLARASAALFAPSLAASLAAASAFSLMQFL